MYNQTHVAQKFLNGSFLSLFFRCMLYFILLDFQTFFIVLNIFYTLHIYMLILLTFYLLENDRRSVETSFFISDFNCVRF